MIYYSERRWPRSTQGERTLTNRNDVRHPLDVVVDLDRRSKPIQADRQDAIKMANLAVCRSEDS